MKYLLQFGIIAGVCFCAEILYVLLPLPVPASVYGLVLLFILLTLRIVKVEQVEATADFFMLIMPLLFISPSVSLISSMEILEGNIIILILMICLSTVVTMAVTGLVSQRIIRFKRAEREKGLTGNE